MGVVVCFSLSAFALSTDSLKAELGKHPASDTFRAALLVELCTQLSEKNADSSLFYALKGLEISQQVQYIKGEIACRHAIGFAYLQMNRYVQSEKVLDSALEICVKTGHKELLAISYYNIGNVLFHERKYAAAIEQFEICIKAADAVRDYKTKCAALINIASIYSDVYKYSQSLDFYLKALDVATSQNDRAMTAVAMSNIAQLYFDLGDPQKALDYNSKAEAVFLETGNKRGFMQSLMNVGLIYAQTGEFEKALERFLVCIKVADSSGNRYWKNIAMGNAGEALYYMGRYDTALSLYTTLFAVTVPIGDTSNIALAENGIGRILLKRHDFKNGMVHLSNALRIVQRVGMLQPALEISSDLADASEMVHDLESALRYRKLMYDLRDSIYSSKNDKRLIQLQLDEELAKKENRIRLLEKDEVATNRVRKIQTEALIVMGIGMSLLALALVLLYNSRKKERLFTSLITNQKREIEQQAARLSDINRYKDKIFSVLSHDLRGPISNVASTLELLDEDYISEQEFKEIRPVLSQKLNAVGMLLDNLLRWAKNSLEGEVSVKPLPLEVGGALSQNKIILQDFVESKKIKIVDNIPPDLKVLCDPDQFDVVVRNIIMNAIKFTPTNGAITLSAERVGESVRLKCSDTGVGMTRDQLDNLFRSDKFSSTYGTEGERGTGLGLVLCNEFIKANGGQLVVTSTKGEGTVIEIVLQAA